MGAINSGRSKETHSLYWLNSFHLKRKVRICANKVTGSKGPLSYLHYAFPIDEKSPGGEKKSRELVNTSAYLFFLYQFLRF